MRRQRLGEQRALAAWQALAADLPDGIPIRAEIARRKGATTIVITATGSPLARSARSWQARQRSVVGLACSRAAGISISQSLQ